MTVNEFFRQFYPADWNSAWEMRSLGSCYGREYTGTDSSKRIFPPMKCADGFEMSVQGHFGAYSYPRDDFAERYDEVEIMCPIEPAFGKGESCGDKMIYGYVPVSIVEEVIAAHGGLALQTDTTGAPAARNDGSVS